MATAAAAKPGVAQQWAPPVPMGKFAMWVFLGTEIMFFTGLIGSYLVLRLGSERWPTPAEVLNIPLTALNTFFLICSSVTLVMAMQGVQKGDQGKLKSYLLATWIIGAVFVGIQVIEYRELIHEGFIPSAGIFPSTFFIMTGFHGLHVAGGVVLLFLIWLKALRGGYTAENYDGVEIAGLYWHFVDLVWIILFTLVYLM